MMKLWLIIFDISSLVSNGFAIVSAPNPSTAQLTLMMLGSGNLRGYNVTGILEVGTSCFHLTRILTEGISSRGEQGIQGVQGIQGPKGDTGDKGEKGDKGDTYTITLDDYTAIALIVEEEITMQLHPMTTRTLTDNDNIDIILEVGVFLVYSKGQGNLPSKNGVFVNYFTGIYNIQEFFDFTTLVKKTRMFINGLWYDWKESYNF